MEKQQRIEDELMTRGSLMKQISIPPMNVAILKMLPTEARNSTTENMDEGSVVLEVTSVKHDKVYIEKYKPSGHKISISEYMEVMLN